MILIILLLFIIFYFFEKNTENTPTRTKSFYRIFNVKRANLTNEI